MWPLVVLALLATPQRVDFSGTWTGTLVNLPGRPDAPVVDVVREIGPLPDRPGACTPWKTTYREGGVVRQVKDYALCRDADGDGWTVDEGGGVRLPARFLGDVLVSAFKYGALILTVRTEMRDGVMEEDIITADDRPATEGIVTMRPRSIQRLRLTRRPPSGRVQ